MVKQSHFLLLFVFIFILFVNVTEVNAMNTGFETNSLSTEEKNTFISNSDILPLGEEPAKRTINCFDVNSNGLIAIGHNLSDRKTICVYSSEGVFQYGYTFNSSGYIGVEWDGDNINIYFVRSDVIVSVNPRGEILDVLEVKDTIENNSYVNHLLYATEKTIGDTKYSIENDMGIFNWIAVSYSQIVISDATGVENIIYDVNSNQLIGTIATLVIVILGVSGAVIAIIREFIKLNRGNKIP